MKSFDFLNTKPILGTALRICGVVVSSLNTQLVYIKDNGRKWA